MGYRFWRRTKVMPGVTLNWSLGGPSVSVGPRGAKLTFGKRGVRATAGIPGSGFFYTQKLTGGAHHAERRPLRAAPPSPTRDPLDLGFLQKLTTPQDEKDFVAGLKALAAGDEETALQSFSGSPHLADAMFLAGFLALKLDRLDEAESHFEQALALAGDLGALIAKYRMHMVYRMAVTDELVVHILPDREGVLLALVEIMQRDERWHEAEGYLHQLAAVAPDDPIVTLSLVEVMMAEPDAAKATREDVVRRTAEVDNQSTVDAALLLYKGRALRRLDMATAARDALTAGLRRTKDRPEALLHALRYERALAYEDLGQHSRSRQELEKLYAQAPDYEDVAQRLGVGGG